MLQNYLYLQEDARKNIFNLLYEKADVGVLICRMDHALSMYFVNPFFYRLSGYSDLEFQQQYHESFMECVYEVDRLDFRQKLKKAMEQQEDAEVTIRLKQKNGKLLRVALNGKMINTNEEDYVICMIKDVQHVYEVESELKMQSARYHVLKTLTKEPIFEYDDLSDTMTFIQNDGTKDQITMIHNYRNELHKHGHIHKDDLEQYAKEFKVALDENAYSNHEFRTNLFDDDFVWYRAIYTTIMDENTGMVKLIGKMQNINQDKMRKQELKEQSMYDDMTKLYNRAALEKQIEQYLLKHPDGRHALMIVDIDNFKMVNDNLGHLFGDTVLINFSSELKKIFHSDEIVGRIGGDEFVVFVPNVSESKLKEKLDNTCRIFDYVYSGNLNEINVSTSVGISCYPKDADSYGTLFPLADRALYYSKQQGKNQYNYYNVHFDEVLASSESDLADHYIMETREKHNNNITRDMIEFAFHILTETKDIRSGIGLVLESLFKKLAVSSALLFEEVDAEGNAPLSYFWKAKQGMLKEKNVAKIELKQWGIVEQILQNNGQLQTDEFLEFSSCESLYQYFLEENAQVVFCDGIFEEEELICCLILTDQKAGREFNADEKNMIRTILKIVSSYLSQLRINQRVKKKIDRLTNYDIVTGRYRYDKFKDMLRVIMDAPKQGQYALLYTDISNFKRINSIYGYSVGDQVLYEISEMLRRREEYVIGCRDFADKLITLVRFSKREDCILFLNEIGKEFHAVQKHFLRHTVQLNTGVYFIEDSGMNVSQMIDNANIARKHAKERLNRDYEVFDAKMAHLMYKNQQIESTMEEALLQGEFKVFLQPKYDLVSGRIVSAEALTRWQKTEDQVMYPNDFIPVFEKNGFITQVDFYVLEVVCKVLNERIREHQTFVNISINQSRYLLQDEHYVEKINHILECYNIPPELMEFELTESMFFEDSEMMIKIMHRLKQLGLNVSIDDFGSGYSSLNVLKDVPADVIKMDKEFLNATDGNLESEVIIRKTVEMAKELHKKVVCEGVETKEQADFLKQIGCDMVQGFLYAKPLPMEEFFALLDRENAS